MPDPAPPPVRSRLAGTVATAGFGLVAFFVLGMNRGLVLSSDIKSTRLPWAYLYSARSIQAPGLSDPVWQFVPWLSLARRELLAGRLPLWNPYQDGGVPLLGNSLSALLSPLVWPVLLLGADPGWNLSLLLRLLLAGGSTFFFLRDLGRSRKAAALGAIVFAVSGPFVAWLEHPLTLCAAPAPLLLLFVRRATRRPTANVIAGVAVSSFLVLAGGHPETQLMVALLATGVLLASPGAPIGRAAALGGALLGAGMASPALLPFIEYFRESSARLGAGRRPFVLDLSDLLRFLGPRLPGSNGIEAAAAVSVVLLLLLPFGAAVSRNDRETRAWGLAALAMLLVVYNNPISRFLANSTPVYWTRWLLFVPLALGVVGSAGFDRLRELLARRGRAGLAAALPLCALGGAGCELFVRAAGVHGVTPASWLAQTTPLLETLRAVPGPFRILPLDTLLSPNSATDYDLEDVRGYDALGPAGWRRSRAALGRFRDLPTQKDVIEPWDLALGGAALNDWNVVFLLAPPQFSFAPEEWKRRKALDVEEIYSGPDGRILRNRLAKPRVRLEGPGFVSILGREPGHWRIDVRADLPLRLRVADPFFPGWTARVDDHPIALALRAGEPIDVPVPAGYHRVALDYRPVSFRVGVLLFAISAATLVALGSNSRRRKTLRARTVRASPR